MHAITQWMSANPALATLIVWPLVTMIVNALFDLIKAHESSSAVLRAIDALLSAAGLDAGKTIVALRTLFGGSSSGGGGGADKRFVSVKDVAGHIDEKTPTSPKVAPRIGLAGAIVLPFVLAAACLPARDAGKLTTDEISCIMTAADDGLSTQVTVLKCGLSSIPDVLKLVEDLMATENAAHKAGVSWRRMADAGASK